MCLLYLKYQVTSIITGKQKSPSWGPFDTCYLLLESLVHDVDRTVHDGVDRVAIVVRADRVEALAVGSVDGDVARVAEATRDVVDRVVAVGPGDRRAALDRDRGRDVTVAGRADRDRDLRFIELLVLRDGRGERHHVGRLVVGRGLNRRADAVVDEERVWEVLHVALPVDAVKRFRELFRLHVAEDAALVNDVGARVGGDLQHFAARAIGDVATQRNRGQGTVRDGLHAVKVGVPAEVGLRVREDVALTVGSEVIDGVHGALDQVSGGEGRRGSLGGHRSGEHRDSTGGSQRTLDETHHNLEKIRMCMNKSL